MMNNLEVAMGAVRDQAIAILKQHEKDHHAGKPCWGSRASAIGFLAHCLGLDDQIGLWGRAMLEAGEYAENHRNGRCRP